MAASSSSSSSSSCHKTSYRARCISLPTRSDPLTLEVEKQLYRLKSSGATRQSPSSPSSLCQNLCGLKELYDSLEDLLQSPLTQQSLANERADKLVNDVLEGSVRLLDICSITGVALLQLKECTQDLQSSIRRRANQIGLENEVRMYLACKRQVNEVICKCLRDLKRAENRHVFSYLLEKNQKFVAIISVLREAEAIAISIFESVLSFINRLTAPRKTTGWSLVTKLLLHKEREEKGLCEMDVNLLISALINKNSCKGVELVYPKKVQKQLEMTETNINGLQGELERVFRSLIKTRVTLLNILNP